jgi:hypothetical protein
MREDARLVLRHDPSKVARLHRSRPTTIGRAESNRLRLATLNGVAEHHAVVRHSLSQGWLVCDWQSTDGTFLEGQRIHQCRRLSDGDEIQLGPQGPVLVFQLLPAAAASNAAAASPAQAARPRPQPAPGAPQAAANRPIAAAEAPAAAAMGPEASGTDPRSAAGTGTGKPLPTPAATDEPRSRDLARPAGAAAAGSPLRIAGRSIPLDQIRSAHVRSRQRFPHSFSWWVLLCLGAMVLLPFPWLFWGIEIAALAAWILLGSRKQHELLITLRDGMAYRYAFANRITALSHRNGIRKAIGQSLESG